MFPEIFLTTLGGKNSILKYKWINSILKDKFHKTSLEARIQD
jgi:hypothetical protein